MLAIKFMMQSVFVLVPFKKGQRILQNCSKYMHAIYASQAKMEFGLLFTSSIIIILSAHDRMNIMHISKKLNLSWDMIMLEGKCV